MGWSQPLLSIRSKLRAGALLALLIVIFLPGQAFAGAGAGAGGQEVSGAFGNGTADVSGVKHPGTDEHLQSETGGPGDEPAELGSLPPGLVHCFIDGRQVVRLERCPAETGSAAPARPTISDLASFRPQLPTLRGEPDGWALKGRPANFIAPVDAHVVAGTLLGRPADVRFTPMSWHWDFGDGATATSATGGNTWAQLGRPRFSHTPTSHTYRERNEFAVSLSVQYRADYRYDGGDWLPIDGSLTVPAGSAPVRVFVGSTVLTADGCEGRDTASC